MGNSHTSPLFDAIAEGDVDAAVKALEAHPVLSHKRAGKKNRTVYHACASSGQIAVLRRLCEHIWHTVPDELGKTHLGEIPEGRSHPTIYRAVNSYDESGLTPLMLACKKGHAGTIQYLLSQGADPWIGDRLLGRCALHHAARVNHPICIEAILTSPFVELTGKVRSKECRLVDYPSSSGYTPLHYAATTRCADAAIALFQHGANPNAKSWDVGFDFIQLDRASTPLHAAARYQNLEMAMVLLKYWDDKLRHLDVTDPRVVENYERIKPYQVIGVRQNKAMARVLDPSTPISQISDPFGEGAEQATPSGAGQFIKVAPLPVYPRSSPTEGQGSEGDKASCGSGWGSSDKVPPGWEDVLSGKTVVGVNGKGNNFVTVYRCAEFAADCDSAPLPPLSSKPPYTGRGGLLRTQSDGRRGTMGLAATSANPLSRTRSGAPHATSSGMFSRIGSSSSSDEDNGVPKRGGRLTAGQADVVGIMPAPSSQSPPGAVTGCAVTGTNPAAAVGAGSSATQVRSSPFANRTWQLPSPSHLQPVTPPRGDMAASGLKTARSVEVDIANPALCGAGGSGAGSGGNGGGLARSGSATLATGGKPPSPDGLKGALRSISRSTSKKLSMAINGGADAASAAATVSPLAQVPTSRGSSPPGAREGQAPPQAFSAWGDSADTKARTCTSTVSISSNSSGKCPASKDGVPDFTRDSHAADAEPVEVTMYPHTRVTLERLKAGDTSNMLEDDRGARARTSHERSGGRGLQHRHEQPQTTCPIGCDGDAGCKGSGDSSSSSSSNGSRSSLEGKARVAMRTNPAFNLSRQGLGQVNDLSEDESRLEDMGRGVAALSPTGSRPRIASQRGPC